MRLICCFGVLLFLLASSCGADSLDKEAALQKIAEERLGRLRANILQNCREEVLEIANKRADSLLLDRASRLRRLAGRPPKPVRPGEPPPKELSAELPLRPLFPYEIRFDSLLRKQLTRDSLMRDSLLATDTLLCPDCAALMANGLHAELPTDSLRQMSVLEVFCLLDALQEECLDNYAYQTAYANHFYRLLLHRPRAVELGMEALNRPLDSLDVYFPRIPASAIEQGLLDSLNMLKKDQQFSPVTELYLNERG